LGGDQTMARTSETHPIRVDFIKSETHPILNQIGITLAPGKKQANPFSGDNWDRDLRADLRRMKDVFGMEKLVSMLEHFEYQDLGIEDMREQCEDLDIEHFPCPIPDGRIPQEFFQFKRDIEELATDLHGGTALVIHCKGGLGRAPLTAACLIVQVSEGEISAEAAIKLVQIARGPDALRDRRQQEFVRRFENAVLERKLELELVLPHMESEQRELVFLVEQNQMQVGIIRFPIPDGRWFYFTKMVGIPIERLPEELKDPDQPFHSLPVSSFKEAFDGFFFGSTIFEFKPAYVLAEYMAQIRGVLESIIETVSEAEREHLAKQFGEPMSFEGWMNSVSWRNDESQDSNEIEIVDRFERTERNFLLYWQFHSIVNTASHSRPLDLISSRQLGRVSPGDRIWIVTVDGNGRLLVAGQMKVGEIVDRDTAIDTIGSDNVWDGELFALPDTSEVPHFIHTVDAHHIAPLLRFGADGSSAFNLPDGRLSPNDLQMMREVSPESSSHLYELWENSYPFPVAGDEYEDDDDDYLDDDNEDWNEGEGIDADEEMAMEMQRLEAEKMIVESKDALRRNPNDAMALYNMGVAHAMLGEPERERDCYNRVLLLEPENDAARFNLGCSFAGQGELEAAANEFQILVDGGTQMPPAHFMLGSMLAQLGREEEGIRALRRGLQYDPEDGQAYFNIGRALMSLGRFSEGISEFEKAKNVNFDDIEMCLLLGMCYRETGEKQKELESYLTGLELNAMAMDLIFNAGTVWAHIHGGEEGRAIPYKDFDGNFMLDDAPTTFHFGLGLIATGVIDEAKGCVEDLGGPATELGSKLTRMIRIAESL